MKEITVPSNCKPLSSSIKDKHSRKIGGEGSGGGGAERKEQPAIHTSESYSEVVTLNPNAFVIILLTMSSDQKTQKHRLDQLKQGDSKERKQLNARAACIV